MYHIGWPFQFPSLPKFSTIPREEDKAPKEASQTEEPSQDPIQTKWSLLTSEESQKSHENQKKWVEKAMLITAIVGILFTGALIFAPLFFPECALYCFSALSLVFMVEPLVGNLFKNSIKKLENLAEQTSELRTSHHSLAEKSALENKFSQVTSFYAEIGANCEQKHLDAMAKNSKIQPFVFSHIALQKKQISSLEEEIKVTKEKLNFHFVTFLEKTLSSKEFASINSKPELADILNTAKTNYDHQAQEKVKIENLKTVIATFKTAFQEIDKQDITIYESSKALIEELETFYENWNLESQKSFEVRYSPLFSLERALLEKKVSSLFLHTFLLQEDGSTRFGAAISRHGINPERALFDVATAKRISLKQYAPAKQYGIEEANIVFSMQDGSVITESDIADRTKWGSILNKLLDKTAPQTT
jgi:hypothetical protein